MNDFIAVSHKKMNDSTAVSDKNMNNCIFEVIRK